jgi:dTDP-4-dehydrorhamnose reductase
MNKVAIFGANGMLGSMLCNVLRDAHFEVIALSRSNFDIGSKPFEEAIPLIKSAKIVINCSGILSSQFSKHTPEQIIAVNSLFPQNLSRFCHQENKQLILISSDGVFSAGRGEYLENDYPNATDLYGLSKASGESPLAMTLRVSIIGEEKENQRSLIAWMKQQRGGEVTGFSNQLWNGVTTLTLASAIKEILGRELYKPGIFHFHSPTTVSKYELLLLINEIYRLNIKVKEGHGQQSLRTLSSNYSLAHDLCPSDITEQLIKLEKQPPQ